MHRRKLISKIAVGGAAAAMAFGAVACDADDDMAPGQEEPANGADEGGLEDDGLGDDGVEGDDEFEDLEEDDGLEDDEGDL